jgi:NTP pyrophosphatase (non-canonical NTP hydrolase)
MKKITFNWYQDEVRRLTFVKASGLPNWVYPAMGLGGETGEVLEEIKKGIREGDTILPTDRVAKIRLELGDVLFYTFMLADSLGFTMEDIADANIKKLTERQAKKLG